jgi:hypothetical protein
MAERSAVNRNVVGSSPTWGAKGIGAVSFDAAPFFIEKQHLVLFFHAF